MGRLLLLGAALLGFHGHAQHHQRYWWPATNTCQVGTIERNGVFRAKPGVVCVPVSAGYRDTPPPQMIGIPINSPQATESAQNYCPLKPGGWCSKPPGVANIGPGYAGN